MPIRWDEPFGLVLIEAMACGTPVLAFDRGGVSESVVHNKTGFLLGTVDEMVQAVTELYKIAPGECRKHVEENFSSQAMSRKYLELYEQLLTGTM